MAASSLPDSSLPDSSLPDSSLPDSSLPDAGLPEPSASDWQIRLEVDEAESRVAVAVDGTGTIVGLATAGVSRGAAGAAWELYSINVVAEQLGSGLADDLILVVAGETDTVVWVLTANERAQSFYGRHGFRVDGATMVDELTGGFKLRMVRRRAAS